MLVLTRNVGQSILIGDNIWITVVKVDGDQVRIGLDAPPEVIILREELAQATPKTVTAKTPPRRGLLRLLTKRVSLTNSREKAGA